MIKSMTDDWQYKSEKLKIFTVPLQEKKKQLEDKIWRVGLKSMTVLFFST